MRESEEQVKKKRKLTGIENKEVETNINRRENREIKIHVKYHWKVKKTIKLNRRSELKMKEKK